MPAGGTLQNVTRDFPSGVGRILVWGRIEAPRGRGAEGAEEGGERGGRVPSPPGEGSGEGAVPPPLKIFDYLILKWRILMHISGILTYLFNFKVLLCNVKQNTGIICI